MNKIEVHNLQSHVDFFSFQDVTFSIEQGTVCGLVGKNGAGKTLLIHSIVGQLKNQRGTILLNGFDVNKDFEHAMNGVGVVWADCPYPARKTIDALITFFRAIYPQWDDTRCNSLLALFQLNREHKVNRLSSGQKMTLQIALTLSHHPTILILDEPTAHLDPFARDLVMDVLSQYMDTETNTMLISSHILSDLEKIADTVLLIEDGELVFHENKDDLTLSFLVWHPENALSLEQVASAVVSERRGQYLLQKERLTIAFITKYNESLRSPSMEEILLFMAYTKAEVL